MRRESVTRRRWVSSGTSRSTSWKFFRSITSTRSGVAARTVTDRGPPSSRLISPKKSPGRRKARFLPGFSTAAEPSMITKNSSPGWPARVTAVPAGTSTTREMSESARSCLCVQSASRGTSSRWRIFSSLLTRGPEGSARRSASLRSCGIEPSRMRPISSMQPPPSLSAPRRLGRGLGLLLRRPEQPVTLRVERTHLALELRAALLGQRGLQSQILRFLVHARQLSLEANRVAPAARPLDPQHRRENDEDQARSDQGPGATRGIFLHGRPRLRPFLEGAPPAHIDPRLAPRRRASQNLLECERDPRDSCGPRHRPALAHWLHRHPS